MAYKTKFSSIVKIKKERVKKIENLIQKIHFDIRVNAEAKVEQYTILGKMDAPKGGDFAQFRKYQATCAAITEQIKLLDEEAKVLSQLLATQQIAHKKALFEMEKINYLEQREVAQIVLKEKKAQAAMMDEIANLLFNNRRMEADA